MMIEKVVEQVRFPASADAGDDLDQAISLSLNQFFQIEVSSNDHEVASLEKIFATRSIFLLYYSRNKAQKSSGRIILFSREMKTTTVFMKMKKVEWR